jgi:MATE family multidrug resistance protein
MSGSETKVFVQGLWMGLICGLACQVCSLLVITARTKWSKIVAEAVQEEKVDDIA